MGTSEKTEGISPVLSTTDGEVINSITGPYETRRGLSPRHVQLMAIGGSIGTGLWV
jgi:amino acid transporter